MKFGLFSYIRTKIFSGHITKSIVSLLIGTLIDKGLIESVEVPVYKFFPDISDYAEETLFKPLGIVLYSWEKNIHGQSWGWAGLNLQAWDLAKIGILVLNGGLWEGEQIVSDKWIDLSTTNKVKTDISGQNYGYQWWIDGDNRIMAIGDRGQYLIINRDLNLVTVFISDLHRSDYFLPYRLYSDDVEPIFM